MVNRRDSLSYEARRRAIVDAAAAEFAAAGYTAATMAAIHRRAGISSGTLFHYFPTKIALLLGVLEEGRRETALALAAIEAEVEGVDAIIRYAGKVETEIAGDVYPGLVRAVADVERLPPVADALAVETAMIDGFLCRHLAKGSDPSAAPSQQATYARAVRWIVDGASADALVEAVPAGALEHAVAILLDGMRTGDRSEHASHPG